jgi:hypothetical protein
VQPQRPRVTGEQARARAACTVTAEVVTGTPADDVPPSADSWAAATEDASRRMAEHKAEGELIDQATVNTEAADPRAGVLAHFERLQVVTHAAHASYMTRLAGKPLASVESLTADQAGWFTAKLAKYGSRDELEAAAVAAEAKREAATDA